MSSTHVERFREDPQPGSDTRLDRKEEAYATEPAAPERFRPNFEGWHDDSVRGGDGLRSSVDQGRDGGGGSAAGGDGDGGPATLRDLATMREIRVRGVELVMSAKDPEMVSLIIDPTSPSQPEIGMILVDQTA
jgi:hypothetical protein